MTDTMGRMHSDAQFAGSSSVPAHVEMMQSRSTYHL
nr:GGGtGRT protein [Bacteroides sp. K03]